MPGKKELLFLFLLVPALSQAQWQRCNMPYFGNATINAIAVDGNSIFVGSSNGLYRSKDQGASWFTASNDSAGAILAEGASVLVAGVGISRDSGITWPIADTVRANCYMAKGSTWYAGSGGSSRSDLQFGPNLLDSNLNCFRKSIDSGRTWTTSDSGLPQICGLGSCGLCHGEADYPIICFQNVMAIAFNRKYLFLSMGWNGTLGATGASPDTCGTYYSFDSGTSWTYKGLHRITIPCIAVNGSYVYSASLGYGVYRSADSGDSWTKADTGLTDTSVLVLQQYGTYLFAGTQSKGVFLSRDSAKSWRPLNNGLTDTTITAFGLDSTYLYAGAGAPNGNFWRIPLSQVAVLKSTRIQSLKSGLKVLSSGRDASSIGLAFSLAGPDHVRLCIYDLSGHLRATLMDQLLAEGTHAVSWDTRSISAGCYFVRLEGMGIEETKRIQVVK